jgi:hypothetical protein
VRVLRPRALDKVPELMGPACAAPVGHHREDREPAAGARDARDLRERTCRIEPVEGIADCDRVERLVIGRNRFRDAVPDAADADLGRQHLAQRIKRLEHPDRRYPPPAAVPDPGTTDTHRPAMDATDASPLALATGLRRRAHADPRVPRPHLTRSARPTDNEPQPRRNRPADPTRKRHPTSHQTAQRASTPPRDRPTA